jgi:hypothetical protein
MLTTILSEYLDCYVVLGFTPTGDAVEVVTVHDAKEYNSICNHLHEFSCNFLARPDFNDE